MPAPAAVIVRHTRPEDFAGIIEVCRRVYPDSPPWTVEQLASHLAIFPEGQFVAVERSDGRVLGMAASLVIRWAEYDLGWNWRDFTDHGMFTNHDASGHTLYGAEVLVRPSIQRRGVGSKLYRSRFDLARRLGLWRIRAAARLRGYHRHAGRMRADEYVERVVKGELKDPTLSFQLRHGFDVMAVVGGYLRHDAESLGYAAVIEWLNPDVTWPDKGEGRDARFLRPAPSIAPPASDAPPPRGDRERPPFSG